MAESSTEQPKRQEKPTPAKQTEFQIGSIGHQVAAGAGAPLDSPAVARIQRNPQQTPRTDLLALQRAVGNRAVTALVRGETTEVPIQAKLQVGPVNDVYEQEADLVARMVTSGTALHKPAANVKSKHADEQEEGGTPGLATNIKRMVQRKKTANHETASTVRADGSFTAGTQINERLQRLEQGGRPLPDSVRRELEPRFGADFSAVKIHTGNEAVQLSRDIGARAFTHGSHIAFGAGEFSPNSQAGRQLLAHELTHTIQQTGARPRSSVQRSPNGVIQRGPTWDKIKNFFSRKKPEPVLPEISAPVMGTPPEIQAAAHAKVSKAAEDARTLYANAVAAANQKAESHNDVNEEMEQAGQSAKLGSAKDSVKAMKSGDAAVKSFIEKYKQDLAEIRDKITGSAIQVSLNNEKVTANTGSHRQLAMQSHAIANEAEQLVAKMREQAANVGDRANTEEAFARANMKSRWGIGGYEARSLPAAEKSASDSVMDLLEIRNKVQGYHLYLSTDLKVLEGHLSSKGASVSHNFSEAAAMRAMGSGAARAESEQDPGMLDDTQAFLMGGGSRNMNGLEGPEGANPEQDPAAMRKAELEAGRLHGQKALDDSAAKRPKPEKAPTLNKSETKFAKQLKRLEIRAMLYAKAQKRMRLADQYTQETNVLYDQAMALYKAIDAARSGDDHSPEQINQAILKAGDAREKVALASVRLEKMRKFKQEVYDESQKYQKYVGERAMNKHKRRAKKVVGMIAGPGLRALTGGLYRVEAEDEAGGYRVGLKSRTIIDDIIKKYYELKQLVKGVDGSHVRGLGGKHGARAYVFFKAIAFALQIVRDISSSVALWVTIVTGGQGAPVGAVFASIALYSGLAKAAVDLLLLIWSGIGLANTNDPESRAILRGENTRQGLAFGEGAFAAASAGMVMGLSGSTGLLSFDKQIGAFGVGSRTADLGGSLGGTVASASVGSATPALGNIGANLAVKGLSPYANNASLENAKLSAQVEKIRKAKSAVRVLSHPVRSAFGKLAEFASRKKRLRKSKFAALLPEIAKTIEDLSSNVDEAPESEAESEE